MANPEPVSELSDSFCRAFTADRFEKLASNIVQILARHIDRVQSDQVDQVIPFLPPADLLSEFDSQEFDGEAQKLFERVLKHSIRLNHPNYLGHQISPVAPIAAVAGLVVDLINNGMGVYEMGMAGTILERQVIQRVTRAFGFDENADGIMTSGGSLANLTAMLAARRFALPDSWKEGTPQQLAVMVSDQSHYCIDRAVRIMGWGDQGIIQVPTNERFQMRHDALEPLLEQAQNAQKQVIAVIGNACSTAAGSFDDLNAIADFCHRHQIWFHVDGAHGAATSFSEKYRHLVDGIHRADSVTLDFHKMLLVPATASALIFKNCSNSYRTFQLEADYLFEPAREQEWFNLARRTFECTKSMMSLKVYSVLCLYGEQIWNENVTRLYDLARFLGERIRSHDNFELLTQPESNIVCFRYVDFSLSERQLNELNANVRSQLCEEGRFYIVQTRVNDSLWLRVTVANAFTSETNILQLLKVIERKCKSLHKTDSGNE